VRFAAAAADRPHETARRIDDHLAACMARYGTARAQHGGQRDGAAVLGGVDDGSIDLFVDHCDTSPRNRSSTRSRELMDAMSEPRRTAMISAAIATAISAGVSAFSSSPIGARIVASVARGTPLSSSAWNAARTRRRLPIMPR